MLHQFNGIEIHEISEEVSMVPTKKQVIFPKRKNKRIQARYRNNPRYWGEVKTRNIFQIGKNFYADRYTIDKMKKQINSPTPASSQSGE